MLTGKTREEQIWNFLIAKGLTQAGAAGLMGNIYAESGLNPQNLQNSYEGKLGYNDAEYTAAVDNGTYANFVRDSAGYGLCQWTYWSRKQALLQYAKAAGKSIGDLETQLNYLWKELAEGYKAVLAVLEKATTVQEASDAVLLQFERPADQSDAAKARRAGYSQTYYDKYAGATTAPAKGVTGMTELELREKLVNIARGFIGCKESDGSHKQIIDLYNSHKPLARGYKVKYTDAWCSTFASACAIKAGLTDITPTECGCEKHIQLFKALGRWEENDAYVPSPGDYIFYDWQDNGVGDNTGASDHVGIVEKVEGKTITVIEGNYSDSVKRRTLAVNGRYIRGYGVPDYSSNSTTNAATQAPSPTTTGAPDAATAIKKLADLGVVNSPDYWLAAVKDKKLDYLGDLIDKAAAKITRAAARAATVDEAITALVAAKVINTPEYWRKNQSAIPNLPDLLCALGGALKQAQRTYTVKPGDSLWAIAAKQLGDGSRYKEIGTLNGLTSNTIHAGQVLTLPAD